MTYLTPQLLRNPKKETHTAELILLGEGEQNAVLRPCGRLFQYYFDDQSLHLIGVKNDFTKMCDPGTYQES
jgi:hypothetical protein